jgi:SP family arabinose:H+ symporter-like MFS transporter
VQASVSFHSVVVWSIVSSLAGFLFGFDTVVISGAERTIQNLWGLSPSMHGVAMAAALYGTVLGALGGGWPTDRFGRRPTLLGIGVLYFVSAVWSALATDVWSFIVARFIGGLGVGVSTVAAPLYIAEIAPPGARGRLAGLFQFNIVFGILAAFVSNALIGGTGPQAWRWMLAAEAVPAAIYTLACLAIPESPRWLALHSTTADRVAAAADSVSWWRMRRPLGLAVMIAVFNQMSGINAVLYFAPRIFEMAGLGPRAALLQSVGIGITNLVFTILGLWLIDRAGRRSLLVIGSLGYIASLGLCAWAFATGHAALVPACLFAFIAAHAVGQGAVIWVFISEIFPDRSRATGQAVGCGTHWICAALVTTLFPLAAATYAPAMIFAFFAGMMVLQLIWALTLMPETKSVPLEELARRLVDPNVTGKR